MLNVIFPLGFRRHDGGRAAAGFKGDANDCVVRAVAIATGKPYRDVHAELLALSKSERLGKRKRGYSHPEYGVFRQTTRRYIASVGGIWTPIMGIGTGCRAHLRADELPPGRLIVKVSKHVCAVIDHVIYDTGNHSRNGTRCVYGYWVMPDLRSDAHAP